MDIYKLIENFRQRWLTLSIATIFLMMLLLGHSALKTTPVQAAPSASKRHQTVPIATPTATNVPLPTVTPTNTSTTDSDDDQTDDDQTDDDQGDDSGDEDDEETTTDQDVIDLPPDGIATGVVDVTVLNVRNGPGADSAVTGTAFQGDILEILGRSINPDDSEWRLVCCAFRQEDPGWVDAQFMIPDFNIELIDELVPIIEQTTEKTIAEGEANTANSMDAGAGPTVENLSLRIESVPSFVWQGQIFTLEFIITNASDQAVTDIALRNDFPLALNFVSAEVNGEGEILRSPLQNEEIILEIVWPSLEANTEVTVPVVLEISSDLADGAIVDNLAVLDAKDTKSYTAGISIGMPPTRPPDFR
ncbi:SH3 domain-containing protein [Chloroflexi bacterium TSY]|nr:SH3 domain-containing protein [Chloroflexi bacterium TSY]